MNTQSHLLLATALLTRQKLPARNIAVVAGALLPDLPLYGLFTWTKLAGIPEMTLWRDIYWSWPWPEILGASHSFVLLGVLLVAGLLLWRRRRTALAGPLETHTAPASADISAGEIIACFAAAALLHALTDFPLHVADGHMQFWPLSSFVFSSPVSYWDPDHHGAVWSLVEALIGITCAMVLWRRFRQWWVRLLCAIAVVLYVAVPAYFIFVLGHHVS